MIDWSLVGQVGAGLALIWCLSMLLLPVPPRRSIRAEERRRLRTAPADHTRTNGG